MMLRKAVYAGASRFGWTAHRRRQNAAPIFCFHNVCEDEHGGRRGDTSLHIGAGRFAEFLAMIARHYRIVPLPELASRVAGGQPVAGLAALSFDDACEGVFAFAVPRLRELRAPFSIFVVSGASSAPAPFWWDVLGDAGRLDDYRRTEALAAHAGERDRVLTALAPDIRPSLPASFLPATWERIASSLGPDVTIGAHTVTHPNLTAAGVDPAAQLERSRAAIRERLGVDTRIASYPYGLRNDAVLLAARSAGIETALTMRYGRARPGDDPLALPRINVPASLDPLTLECWAAELRWPRPK